MVQQSEGSQESEGDSREPEKKQDQAAAAIPERELVLAMDEAGMNRLAPENPAAAAADKAAAAIRERDLALAMHETFLSSGSEDALSPRFLNLDIRSPPRTPRSTSLLPSSSSSSFSASSSSASPASPVEIAGAKSSKLSVSERVDQKIRQKNALEIQSSLKEGEEDVEAERKLVACLKRLRETEFDHHEQGTTRLNNGSFGTCPKSVLSEQERWVQKWLAQPDDMYFGPLEKGLLASREIVAAHVNCPVEELVLVDNVTAAASVVAMDVMWSFSEGQFQRGDCILLSNFTYGTLYVTFEAYAVRAGAHILIADIPFPTPSALVILESYEKVLQKAQKDGRKIRMALLDHVVSMPSIILPLKELVSLCREYGVEQVFVDGAHALGNVQKVDLTEIDADYYAGNLHKWFFAPTSVAFFHCKAKHLSRLHHPIISHNYGKGFAAECEWIGTRDYSAMLAVPAAFEFFKKIPGGYEAVRAYNHKQVIEAGKMLARAWDTEIGVDPSLQGSMVMVGLPPGLGIETPDETFALRTRLRNEFSIEVHTFSTPKEQDDNFRSKFRLRGVTAYVRVSHQIYNTWSEYLRLRDVINGLVVEKSKK